MEEKAFWLLVEFTLKDGSVYAGEWQDGYRMHGWGKWTFSDGRYYDGEWVKGARCGYGVFVFPDGEKYEGEWKDNVRHGKGKYTFVSGEIWEGDWVEDKFVGQVAEGKQVKQRSKRLKLKDYKARADAGDHDAAYAVAALSIRKKSLI